MKKRSQKKIVGISYQLDRREFKAQSNARIDDTFLYDTYMGGFRDGPSKDYAFIRNPQLAIAYKLGYDHYENEGKFDSLTKEEIISLIRKEIALNDEKKSKDYIRFRRSS